MVPQLVCVLWVKIWKYLVQHNWMRPNIVNRLIRTLHYEVSSCEAKQFFFIRIVTPTPQETAKQILLEQ